MENGPVKDLLQLIAFFLILGILWFINVGKDRIFNQRFNVSVTDSSGNTVRDANHPSNSYTQRRNDSGKAGGNSTSDVAQNPYLADTRYVSIPNKSRYFKQVTMGYPRLASYSKKPSDEYVQLNVDRNITKPIVITGWTLRSTKTGVEASIPKAVLLPQSESGVNEAGESSVTVRPGDTVILSSGRSPVFNSFLINKCSGYFSQFKTFNPYLNTSCPYLKNEPQPLPPNALDDRCLDYIDTWPRCTIPTSELPQTLTQECRAYIREQTTYGKCITAHKNDADFYSNEWRVFLKRDQPLWKNTREEIQLLDFEGKLVDQISY